MRTVAETPVFIRYAAEVWRDAEREELINFIAANPEAGKGQGKQGGARVIYFLAAEGTVWLLIVYKKAKYDNLPTTFLAELKKGVEDAL